MTEQEYIEEQAWIADKRHDRLMQLARPLFAEDIEALLDQGFDVICDCVAGGASEPFLATSLAGKALEIAPTLGIPVIVLCIDTGKAHYFN